MRMAKVMENALDEFMTLLVCNEQNHRRTIGLYQFVREKQIANKNYLNLAYPSVNKRNS